MPSTKTGEIEALAALALGMFYLSIMSGHLHSIDGLMMWRQARSLAYAGSLHLDQQLWPGLALDTSKYGVGLSLLYIPGLIAGWWLRPLAFGTGSHPWDLNLYYSDGLYTAVGAPLHILITVAAAYMVARFIRELGFGTGAALLGMALYGLASPVIVYARGDYAQPLEGLCWLLALYAGLRVARGGGNSARWVCAAALFYAILTRPVEGLLLAPAVAALLVFGRPEGRAGVGAGFPLRGLLAVGGSVAAGLAVTLLVNWARYGSPFITGYGNESWTTPIAQGLAGALLSPGRGILWQFPAVVMLPAGLLLLKRKGEGKVGYVLLALAAAQLLNVALWVMWWGGWNWGLRLYVPAFPLLAIVAACGLQTLQARARHIAAAALLLLGILWVVPCVITDLYGGYGDAYDGPPYSFRLSAYPPLGAWAYIDHWFAENSTDTHAVDILWFRLAKSTGGLSLLAPLALLAASAGFAVRAAQLGRQASSVALAKGEALTAMPLVGKQA